MVVSSAVAADERPRLAELRDVTVSVDLVHPLDGMTADDVTEHLVGGLRKAEPPLTIRDGVSDRIRLTVTVRPMSATTLRGFWLPLSGTYGIGALRLGVERMVTLSGSPRALPALVWQTERIVGIAWRETNREIVRLLDEMVAEFLEARRHGNTHGHEFIPDRAPLQRRRGKTSEAEVLAATGRAAAMRSVPSPS